MILREKNDKYNNETEPNSLQYHPSKYVHKSHTPHKNEYLTNQICEDIINLAWNQLKPKNSQHAKLASAAYPHPSRWTYLQEHQTKT
jgi:hypothetical protein